MFLAILAGLLTLFLIAGGACLFIMKYKVDDESAAPEDPISLADLGFSEPQRLKAFRAAASDYLAEFREAMAEDEAEPADAAEGGVAPRSRAARGKVHPRKRKLGRESSPSRWRRPERSSVREEGRVVRASDAKPAAAPAGLPSVLEGPAARMLVTDGSADGSGPAKEARKSSDKEARKPSGKAPASHAKHLPPVETMEGVNGEVQRSRFVAMGVISAAVFGSLAAKLWAMQVLQSSEYSSQAEDNLYSTSYTPAPRGVIYDADGIALVKNRSVYTVLAEPDVASDRNTMLRLSVLLGIPYEVVRQRAMDTKYGAQGRRIIAEGVSQRNLAYLSEHADAFPGVSCETRTTRVYPYGALAAHVLGYVGTVSEEELAAQQEGRVLRSGDIVGKSGIEQYYDSLLAGDPGARVVITDADGNVQKEVSQTDPIRGSDVYLTIKAPVQQVADNALRSIIAPNGVLGSGYGTGGAIVCMDCTNGEVVAMSSFPTFSPESFIGGITQEEWDAYNTEESRYPLMNRAIAGSYPAASTFKAFVSAAALEYGISDANSSYTCTGTWTGFGEDYAQDCWLLTGHGPMGITSGIANSCDVVFYEIGKAFFEQSSKLGEECLQDYIETFGFGSLTGIDIHGETEGRVPTPKWKAQHFREDPDYATWVGADMTNMCIGQGYVLVTPLQLCCAYGGVATGTVYKPHLLREVRNTLGDTVLEGKAEELSTPKLEAGNALLIHQGLEDVLVTNQYDVKYFNEFDCKVAGKTGTAEVAGQADYTWFACYAPADKPKYVAACVTEQGVLTDRTGVPMLSWVLKAALDYDSGDLDQKLESVDSAYSVVQYQMTSTARTD